MGVPLPEDLKEVLDGPNFAHLTTLDPDGHPQASAMWVGREGDLIHMNTEVGRRKERNLRRDPRVAISISPHRDPYANWSIQGRVVELRREGARDEIDRFAERYLGGPATFVAPDARRVTVVIEALRIA